MNITFPFVYRAEVLLSKGGIPKEELFVETIDVEVPELSRGELVEALRYRDRTGQRTIFSCEGGFLQEVVDLDIDDYAAVPISMLSPEKGAGEPVDRIMKSLHAFGSVEYNALSSWYCGHRHERVRDPARVREWFRSDREDAYRRAVAFYGGIVSLDGNALIPCAEPKIVSPSLRLLISAAEFTPDPNLPGDPIDRPVFNVVELDDAQADAENRGEGWRPNPNYEIGSLEILAPDAFKFNRGTHALKWAASYLFDTLCKEIRDLPEEAIPDWIALKHLVMGRTTVEWDHSAANIVERCKPFARNGHTRLAISRYLEIWEDLSPISVATPAVNPTRPTPL